METSAGPANQLTSAATSTPARTFGFIVLGGAALGIALLLARPPVEGAYPVCPWKVMTGLDCPFCGGMRCVSAMVHGDLAAAVDYNVLVAVGVPIALLLALVAVVRGPRAQPMVDALFANRSVLVIWGLVMGFFLLRLLPIAPWLTSSA